jgi:hypothetical protein
LRTTHLPSAATANSAPPTQNRLQAVLSLVSLALFALFRSRSTDSKVLNEIRPLF